MVVPSFLGLYLSLYWTEGYPDFFGSDQKVFQEMKESINIETARCRNTGTGLCGSVLLFLDQTYGNRDVPAALDWYDLPG